MRQILSGIACLIVSASPASAQIAPANQRASDSAAHEMTREFFNAMGEIFHLPPISASTSDTLGIELRIVESNGPGMSPFLVLREMSGVWSARRLDRHMRDTTFSVQEFSLTGNWGELWDVMRKLGLLDLPSSGGNGRYLIQEDGHSMLIALRQGKSYRFWDYRLEPPLDAEMKLMLEIASAIRTVK